MIVEPKEGYPDRVDREYVVVQSEFYAKPDPAGRKVDGAALHVLDGERLRLAQPTHTVFNGFYNGMVREPLPARSGERVRLYVLNVGPSHTTSFHVVGTILDKVYLEGSPANLMRGMQTVLLGASNSAVVEFVIPEPGAYVMVDHQFANASQGAVGLISTEAKGVPSIEHHNIPASATPTDPEAVKGKQTFESKCIACHSIGQGPKMGPDLAGVAQRGGADWIRRWLKEPERLLASDPKARALMKQYHDVPMPNQNLSGPETDQLVRYFDRLDKK